MKIELIENTEFGFYNIKFGSRPDYEHNADMLNELKANGWAWSRHNGVWYPRTTDAKAKANTFAAEFAKKYNEPEKSFGQELFERTQRIDQWKKEHLPQEQNNEPVKEESKPVELNDNQKKVYDLLKATNNFSENQILEMVSKIDTAYQTENFNIPELSWEEIKSFIHADDSFDLAKDLRDLYNPNISETYNKINVVYNYLHDLMDFDVLGENQYERNADAEYHRMRESIRHDILQPVCENIVMDRYSDFFDMQEDFISRREEKIADISKSYMENPVIKEQYIGMKRAELLEKAPEMLKGREFNSWIFNIDNDGHFLFYESNGYLKSEYLNDDKYNSVKDFLSQVEQLDLLEESSKQLKEEYTKMHSLLEKPPVQIQDELIAKELEEELANADERIDTSVSEYNDLGIDTRTGEPWNGEESEDVFEPEIQEEGSTELTQADLDNATKVIPEKQYQFMLENAAGEEAEYFKKKLKNMATICADLQKHSNKENVNKDGSHPCKLHYFLGNCDWYISELNDDGIGFGYCILNGDLYNSEWGSVNVCGDSTYEQPLTKMSINVPIRINGSEFHRSVSPELDLHLDEDTTIERELYKLDNEYFADYKKYAEKNEKILAKSSEVSINIIEETNQELEVENGSKTDIGYERRTGISSGSNPNQGLEERGAYSDRGSDTGRGQRVLHSEREENGSLENSEGISELHTVGRESEISDLHIEEIQSGNNEVLHSERSLETGNSDLQQTGMENGQIPHRVRTVEPEYGTGVNPNENTSSEPLHGNEEVIEITLVERSALNLLAVNSDCYWYIEKNKNPENYNVMPKQDLIDLGSYAYPYENYVSKDNAKIINDLLEKYDIHYQKLSIHVNQNLEQNIEQEADKQFKEITNQYDTQYKDFYDTYNKMKESYTENESRYVSDARIGDMFRQVHRELVNLQMNELTDLIKQAPNADIARINATRYFNFCGQDEFSYLHDNLYLRCNLGDYTKDNGRRFVAPTGEELQNFIEETYNSLHGIVAEKETPVYNINGTEYTQETIETLITEDIQNVLNTLSHVPVIEGVRLYQNPEQTGAINILLQYSTKNNDVKWSEDSLFNVLAQEEFTFNGMPVDVNPITPEKSGTIEQYLERFERGISVSENIAQEGRPVEQLTSKKDIKAIREQCREILQKSDSEITEADKAILAQYEGAGGIKEDNRTVSGILNEFYTPNNLVEKVWQIVDAYAPGAKTVLEPSAGVGKFANNRPNNEFTMHELDETSARINKILHPDANVIQGAYQKQFFDAGERIHTPGQKSKYDVVIGNPPYGTYNDKYKGLGEGKEFDRYEEYFISKGLDALKDENSVMVFVVPSGFLNTASDKQKEIIAAKGRLIDAYRLPVGTFPTTEVGTDIIIMRTWEKDRKIIMENGKGNAAYKQASLDEAIELISDNISNGEWFKQHPEKILGEVKQKTNRFGKLEDVVVVHEGLTVQDELNKIDNFVEGINNSRKLRTYSVLNKDKINELTVVTQEEFNSIIDALYNQPSPDYKSIPSIIKLPQINQTLAQKLGVENANFFMRSEIAHVRPQRKGNYDQALRIDEMKGMLNFLKSCQTAYIDNDERHQNFILAGLDSQNSNKTNKIVFNKDENGNYIVTIGKVDSVEFNGGKYSRVAVGFEPTILRSKLEVWSPIATMLRSSTTPLDSTIPQQTEKSSQIIAPAPVQPEQTQSVSDQSETVAEEIDDPTKRLYEDPDGVFKTKHQLTREEFAKFYTGANFTQEDYNIWGATDWKGNVDTSKLTESELSYLKTSDNYVETNEGVYTNAMLYATGNIYQKLDELEENKENLSSESYEKAKAILTNAIPKVVPIENIKIDALSPLAQEFKVHREVTSSRWYMGRTELQTVELDIDLREDFINWATNCSSLDNFDENNQSINSRRSIYNYSSAKISREDIPEDISWTDIVNYIDRVPVPTHIDEKNDTKEVKNKKNLIAGNIKDARKNTCYELFNRYIQDGLQQEDKERLQSTWNRIYNATVHADYKKLPLFIDGMSTFKNNQPFMLYKQQVEGVSRLLSKGNGLLAYEVGVGKTAAGIVTTMGQLQTGRCKRPLIIVPNQVYKKWVNDFRELFPDVKINELYNLSEKYIDKHFDERTHSLLIEPGSVTVITDSALQKITFSDAVCSKELAEDFSYLLGVSDALHSGDDKEKAKAYQKIQNEIGKASRVQVKKLPEGREQRIQQSYIFFDECGFDNVVIDEAHRYKNLFTIPRPKRGDKGAREFEGLGTGKPSIRAEKVFGITTLIQRRNEDRNVFLLTATPFTNNPLEVYSMLSYMGRKELINRHIYDVRDFCTEFAQTKFEYSVKPTGDIEPKQVMKNFRGQKKLKNLVFEYIDAVSAKEAGIERPEGERHPIYLELSTLQQKIIKLEQDAIAASDDPSVTLKAMTTMRTCTLSPALLEPDDFASVEDIVIPPKSQIVESSPKLSWVCNTVADLYKQKPECGQFIYMPQGKDCFDEVKKYLIKQGIPDDAIDYIHSTHNGSAEDKDKISARFNNKEDKLKILIGTATVAEGIDLNGNSIVEYNTMLGWNPTESIQVEGRIWRQGNEQGKVHIMYPLMENSIDALIYQKHDEKASRINSVLSKTDDGKDAIDTDEINPETIKFELITDPTKKVKMIIDEKTAEKRKEIKVIDNRLETIQELEEDRQNSKTLYDTNVEEKEKYKSLLKTAREELKADPNNWQKEARVTSNERAVDTCNKEIAKARNRLNAISYNFNKFDIHEPEREVPIKLQELVTKKAELEADITDIENSKDRLIAEEQKKLLEKKILSKPVEELRKEWVEYVNKNTWYKKQNDKSKDRKETVQVPLEAVKDFKVPDEMIKKFDKAMAEMDFKVLHNYLNWGDRDIINDCHENDKAIVIFRERYEKTKGVKLPEQFRKTTEYLVSVCDGKTLPEVCKFKSMKEAVAYACSSWHGEAYQRDGYVEYVTLDNFKKNRDVSALAKDLQNREGQSYYGYGSPNGFGYDCSPKGVKIEAFINKKREEFFVNWNQVAKIKAKQWNREYPAEFTIKDEPKREGEEKLKNIQMVQQDLFDFDEVKVQTKTLDIRMQGYNSQFILSDQALENYRGLPPFIKKSDNEWVIRCKGEDFAKPQEGIDSYELVDISLTKDQLQGMVKAHLFAQQQEISHKKFDDPEYKGKVICPKSEVSDMQKELLKSNGISDNNLKKVTKENFNELLCDGEKPILKKKLPQPKQLKQENNQKLLPSTTIEIAEDTDFDYVY